MNTWILVANGSEAKLYECDNLRVDALNIKESFEHPESREKGEDLTSDEQGHFQTDHKARSAYEAADPKELEAESFMRELISGIMKGCNVHAFSELVVVMPSHLYGYFKKHFPCKSPDLKQTHIDKDYTSLQADELVEQIRKIMFV